MPVSSTNRHARQIAKWDRSARQKLLRFEMGISVIPWCATDVMQGAQIAGNAQYIPE